MSRHPVSIDVGYGLVLSIYPKRYGKVDYWEPPRTHFQYGAVILISDGALPVLWKEARKQFAKQRKQGR